MQAWLQQDSHDNASLIQGAEMVLKLTRNVAMYQTIMRRPSKYESKIRYELQKFLPMRLQQMTTQDVQRLSAELIPEVREAIDKEAAAFAAHADEDSSNEDTDDTDGDHSADNLSDDSDADGFSLTPPASGMRPDHDSLPDSIRQLWADNRSRWLRIKQLYNTLLGIEMPCDRYEYLAQLKDLWYTYKSALQRYDSYTPGDDNGSVGTSSPAALAKDIANARSYITKNADRLAALHTASRSDDNATKQLDEYNALLAKVQQRVDLLDANDAPIGDELRAKLQEAGIK